MCLQLLDEVRAVGPQRMGTSLAGNMVAELVVLLRDFPSGKHDFLQGHRYPLCHGLVNNSISANTTEANLDIKFQHLAFSENVIFYWFLSWQY